MGMATPPAKQALGIEAYRLRRGRGRQFPGAEQVLCPLLGRRRLRGKANQGEQAKGRSQQGCLAKPHRYLHILGIPRAITAES